MKVKLNLGKKHLYIASAIILILALFVFAAGPSKNPGHSYDQLDLAIDPITIDQLNDKVTIEGDLTVTEDIEGKLLGVVDTSHMPGVDNSEDGFATEYNGCTKIISIGNPNEWVACPAGFFVSAAGSKTGGGILAGDPIGSELNHAYFVIFLCCPLPGY